MELTFENLRQVNVARCEESFFHPEEWTLTDWACALAGEAGEACNKIKKLRRGECIGREEIAKELADVVCYADLLAHRAGIDLGAAVRAKFNEVSARVGSEITL